MNRRQAKKAYKNPLGCSVYNNCINWGLYCPQPEEPCSECEAMEVFRAKKMFGKMLKAEGFSMSGWELTEIPYRGVFIFYQKKKRKEITLEKVGNLQYLITVFDFHSSVNKVFGTMKEALSSKYQNYFYAPYFWKGISKNKKKAIKLAKRIATKKKGKVEK